MRSADPSVNQIFLFGILLVYFERLDGFILLCPASNINCSRKTNSPSYDNVHIGSHENLLKKLYRSSNVLQVAPKAKITKNEETRELEVQKNLTTEIVKNSENKEKTHELEIQKEVAKEISDLSGYIRQRTLEWLKRIKSHQKIIQEDHELGKKQIGEELLLSFLKKRQQFEENIQKLQGEQVKPTSQTMIRQWWKLKRGQAAKKVKKWPQVTPKAKITEKKEKSNQLVIQNEVDTETSEALKAKKWPEVTLKEKIRQNKEKTQELDIQKELPTEISETLKVKSWLRGTFKEKIRGNIKNKLGIQKEVTTKISEVLKAKMWPKGILKEKIRQKEKSHELGNQKEVPTEISKALKVKSWLKGTFKEKMRQNKEKSHELKIQTEVAIEISEALKAKKWLKVTPKEKIIQNKEKTHELENQKKVAIEISEALKTKKWPKVTLKEKIGQKKEKSHGLGIQKEVPTKNSEAKNLKRWPKVTLIEKIRGNKEKTHELEIQKELTTEISEALKFKKWPKHQFTPPASVHSLWKRSILHLPTQQPPLTSSIAVDDDEEEQPGKLFFILTSGNRSARPSNGKHIVINEQVKEKIPPSEQITENPMEREVEKEQESREENLYRPLIIDERNFRIPTEESETFNKLLADKTLSNEEHWEYQEQTTSAPLLSDFLSSSDNYFIQDDVSEAEVQKRLAHLIVYEPMRNLIASLIHMTNVNCRELPVKEACDFLSSNIGFTIRNFYKIYIPQENSALRKSYLLPTKNETNITTASSRKMERPSNVIPKKVPQYGKWLWAISVTTVMVVIIVIISLIEIFRHQTAKGTDETPVKWTFLGRKKEDTPEKQTSAASFEKQPPWHKDVFQCFDKIREKYSNDKIHEESTEEEEIFNRDSARSPEIPELLPVEII